MADFSAQLPPLLAEIAQIAGPMSALRVAEVKGGTRAYIPTVEMIHDGHWLAAVGMEAARKIASALGGTYYDVPLGPAGRHSEILARIRRAVEHGLDEGLSVNQISRQVGVCRRTVFRHKNGETDPLRTDQHRLF